MITAECNSRIDVQQFHIDVGKWRGTFGGPLDLAYDMASRAAGTELPRPSIWRTALSAVVVKYDPLQVRWRDRFSPPACTIHRWGEPFPLHSFFVEWYIYDHAGDSTSGPGLQPGDLVVYTLPGIFHQTLPIVRIIPRLTDRRHSIPDLWLRELQEVLCKTPALLRGSHSGKICNACLTNVCIHLS